MFDARYHFFYFIAIFLMLGFGILIGASYYGPVQVQPARKKPFALWRRKQTGSCRTGIRRGIVSPKMKTLSPRLRPTLVRGKLAGKRVILIQTGDYADATEAANTALGDAGATVVATVALTDKWGALTPKQRAALQPSPPASDPAAQDTALLAALAAAADGRDGCRPDPGRAIFRLCKARA